MNNGGGDGGSQIRELHGKRNLFRGNDFVHAIAKMAVAQICESVEVNGYQESQTQEGVRFSSYQESALETLTDVAVQYIESIGKTAHLYANIAGRVEGNSVDIVQALEDLGSGLGFAGVTDTDHCLADSCVVKDIIRYTGAAEEMPFVYSLPRFPFNKEKRQTAPSFSEVGGEPPDEHIPVWLPAFPETKLSDRSEETNGGTIEGDTPSKENGSSLSTRQHSLDGYRLEILKSQKDAQKETEGDVEGNPFLTAPLRFVENKVSLVLRPLELSKKVVSINRVPDKHMSIPVLESSTPSDEINKKNKLAESEVEEKKDGAGTERALVGFKIRTLQRPTCLAIYRSFQENGWLQEDEEEREKKSEIDLGIVDSDVK